MNGKLQTRYLNFSYTNITTLHVLSTPSNKFKTCKAQAEHQSERFQLAGLKVSLPKTVLFHQSFTFLIMFIPGDQAALPGVIQ